MAVKYDEEEKPEVQLTSMMDCIFLILIFFLVSSQLKKIEKEVEVELPEVQMVETAKDVKAVPNMITVSVTHDGDIYVSGNPVGPGELRNRLSKHIKNPFYQGEGADAAAKETKAREEMAKSGMTVTASDARVRLDGDLSAPFHAVVHVLDVCKQMGLPVIGIHVADGKIVNPKQK